MLHTKTWALTWLSVLCSWDDVVCDDDDDDADDDDDNDVYDFYAVDDGDCVIDCVIMTEMLLVHFYGHMLPLLI